MSVSTRLKNLLDENKVSYSVLAHQTTYTAQGTAATMQIAAQELAKTVVLFADGEMILAVLPGQKHVKLHKLGVELGKPVRLASELEFKNRFPDCESGAMPGRFALQSAGICG